MMSTEQVLYDDQFGETVGLHELQTLATPPANRFPALTGLLAGNETTRAFEAGLLLAAWGHDDGMRYLERFIAFDVKPTLLGFEAANFGQYGPLFDEVAVAVRCYRRAGGDEGRGSAALRGLLRLFEPEEFMDGLKLALLDCEALELTQDVIAAIERASVAGHMGMASRLLPPLARWHGTDAMPIIEPFLAVRDDPAPRLNAVEALRYVDAYRADVCLRRLNSDQDADVRWLAQTTLRSLDR